uniref:Uncharacterized protein n=1 Tax=Meloidogyne hapla TaxID=6305 RepID=A0A1I8BZM6_MELHA
MLKLVAIMVVLRETEKEIKIMDKFDNNFIVLKVIFC